ncbi:MAG: cold shock domain-containing protein [Rubricoccaceae bacterium]|nr:cold shock domain-containing protein [Rubricoccaceae bacterium]
MTSFDARRGIGFVQQQHGRTRIPFSVRGGEAPSLQEGDAVEYRVTGGKTGPIAYSLRRIS